jgi:glycosyltransferase involved in cell wall biosynthesis
MLDGCRVAYFGHHDPSYSRNRILAKALTRAGAAVTQLADRRPFVQRTPGLVSRATRREFDVLVVGFPSHSDMLAAHGLARWRGVPTVFDPLTSLWENAVVDRQTAAPGSVRAGRYRLYDRLSCRLADVVLLDTEAHIDFFCDEFGLPRTKFRRVWVGADEELMKPRDPPPDEDDFVVFFYGSFLPFQGVEYIVRAAHLLEQRRQPVRFRVCGDGLTYPDVRNLSEHLGVRNVEFLPRCSVERLAGLIAQSHLCLGVFGTNAKALRVIPNKLFDALACRRAVITCDTPAIREVLTDRDDVWLCPAGDEEALADAVAALRDDSRTRERIAERGHELFARSFSTEALAPEIGRIVRDAIERHSRLPRPRHDLLPGVVRDEARERGDDTPCRDQEPR